jgi:hypothetical protein
VTEITVQGIFVSGEAGRSSMGRHPNPSQQPYQGRRLWSRGGCAIPPAGAADHGETEAALIERIIGTLRVHESELRRAGIRRLSLFGPVSRDG